MKKKLISVLTAMAVSMSAAAAASVVMTLTDRGAVSQETKAEKPGSEVSMQPLRKTTVRASPAGTEEILFMQDLEEEEILFMQDLEEEEEGGAVSECDFMRHASSGDTASALEEIRTAERRAADAEPERNGRLAYVDVGNCADAAAVFACTAGTSASNEQILWSFFKALGFTDAGAAAALGNLAMESGLNPAAKSAGFDYQGGTGGAGLAGWMSRGRLRGLMELAEKKQVPWQDLSLQMSYLQYELENTRRRAKAEMMLQTDIDFATDCFCVYFEGCIGRSAAPAADGISGINGKWYQGLEKRKALARLYYSKYVREQNKEEQKYG